MPLAVIADHPVVGGMAGRNPPSRTPLGLDCAVDMAERIRSKSRVHMVEELREKEE